MKYKEVALTWNILSTLTYMKIRFFFSWAQLKYLPNQFWFLLSKVEDPIAKAEREFFAIIKKVFSASYLHLWWGKDEKLGVDFFDPGTGQENRPRWKKRWFGRGLFTLVTNSLTNWLTDSCLVNLINVSLACEDGNSKLVEICYCC